jgi:uncharacterized RDD family membrane protein YckC
LQSERDAVGDFFKTLSHPVRREMIRLLYERIELSYTELLNELKIDEGQLNFHLRAMKVLLDHSGDGRYKLNNIGKAAYHMIKDITRILGAADYLVKPKISGGLFLRLVVAFLLDVAVFFVATGAFLDENVWHLAMLHWADVSKHMTGIIEAYAHIFFATFIVFTLLEAYKGQTLGKYLMGIRVVAVTGRRLTIVESGIRNAGKVFLLPIDLIVGIIFLRSQGYVRFFDYYTRCMVESIKNSVPSQIVADKHAQRIKLLITHQAPHNYNLLRM